MNANCFVLIATTPSILQGMETKTKTFAGQPFPLFFSRRTYQNENG